MPLLVQNLLAIGIARKSKQLRSSCACTSNVYLAKPYCSYLNFGKAGSYNRVSYMDDSTGTCNFTPQSYSGSISPYDEEVSKREDSIVLPTS